MLRFDDGIVQSYPIWYYAAQLNPARPNQARPRAFSQYIAVFSFLYFLKIKISKIYVRFEIFQKYPRSPPHRATGPKCNFFLQICNEIPGKKGACRPPAGDRGAFPPHLSPKIPPKFQKKREG